MVVHVLICPTALPPHLPVTNSHTLATGKSGSPKMRDHATKPDWSRYLLGIILTELPNDHDLCHVNKVHLQQGRMKEVETKD